MVMKLAGRDLRQFFRKDSGDVMTKYMTIYQTKLVVFAQVCMDKEELTPVGIAAMFENNAEQLLNLNRLEMQAWLEKHLAEQE